jgi:hypothetical protein
MNSIEGLQAGLGQGARVAGKADAILHGWRGVGRGRSYGRGACRLDNLIFRHGGFRALNSYQDCKRPQGTTFIIQRSQGNTVAIFFDATNWMLLNGHRNVRLCRFSLSCAAKADEIPKAMTCENPAHNHCGFIVALLGLGADESVA